MTIKLLVFASVADVLGQREQTVDLPPGASVEDLLDALIREHPRLKGMRRSLMVSVNQDYVERDTPLSEGDEVALIPPVSGGSSFEFSGSMGG